MISLKKIGFNALLLASICTISCSSSDDGSSTPITYNNYSPLTVGNTWTYAVSSNDGTNVTNSTDVITADADVVINSKTYTDMSMSQGSTGIMSGMLDQNNFRSEEGVLYMKGEIDLPLSQLGGTDHSIVIDDVELINQNKNNGDILSEQPGSTNQTIQGITIDVSYVVKTKQGETLDNHTVDGQIYNNVIVADIIISASATTPVNNINFPILNDQEIYIIKNYYAEGIGLIDSDATFSYSLVSVPGINLPIPNTGSTITDQEITSYTVN
ncbi:hypothetical protein [Pseudofulvibacter geojedonensis]|uniref:Lipoprotein n=1 Tax=Pseudofulvibacter geojedonensis TaxID=1123758 RepID=A0ABW3I2V0_9FLAO